MAHPSIYTKNASVIITSPHFTEKSARLMEGHVYTFLVSSRTNKTEIKKAITELYKVVPKKIAIVNSPAKNVFRRGKWGKVSAKKKAVVYLKPGDKIEIA